MTANNIAMWTLELPTVLVLEPTSQAYYLPDVPGNELTLEGVASFLDDIREGRASVSQGAGSLAYSK